MLGVHEATAVPLDTHVTPAFLMNSYELHKHSAVQTASVTSLWGAVYAGD